ncbi:MAG: type III-A CRISPR-associated protein Cas10/Csm1 [Candidatus Lokiarchaeota archaeon]|nr:type III-A CRISPR-associated protein Cas10/Csm1 [Candidatus Lokiarchaeota archaeon]
MNPSTNFQANIRYLNEVLYASFLHDIGKLYWRADRTQPEKYSSFSQEDLGKTGAHSKWSASFYEEFLRGNLVEDVNENLLEQLILFHHNPESEAVKTEEISKNTIIRLLKIIQIADHASSGERLKRGPKQELGNTRTEVMHSIFATVKEFDAEGYYKIAPLETDKSPRDCLFPKKSKEQAYGKYASDTQPLYKTLFQKLTHELKSIIEKLGRISFLTLFNLFYKYLINVPSATYVDIPDISLFDHMKSSAAIAVCLHSSIMHEYEYDIEKVSLSSISDTKKSRFLFVGGNISGIQKFIYSIASKGAAKGLKGRSFFVQVLGETISKFILESFSLPDCCEVYCDGGNFYLIVPAHVEKQLEQIRLEIKRKLLNHFKGDLFIDIGWIKCNRGNFSIIHENGKNFNEIWSELNSLLATLKYRRYNDILTEEEGFNTIFNPLGMGGKTEKLCSVCKQEKRVIGEDRKCDLCSHFEELTRELINAEYIIISRLKQIETDQHFEIKDISDFTKLFGIEIILVRDKNRLQQQFGKMKSLFPSYSRIELVYVNNTKMIDLADLASDLRFQNLGLRFKFINTIIPKNENGVKDFDQIAKNEDIIGTNKIGILRMDIDDLGTIFSMGLNPNSLSRLTSLSLRLKLFFKYWINEICKGEIMEEDISDIQYFTDLNSINPNSDFLTDFIKRIENNLYLLYSSGDDLFLIGHWNDIIILAELIKNIFSKYVLENEFITISAGIIIIDPKFPLYQAADKAGSSEEKAKNNEGKDSLCLMDKVYKWKDFQKLSILKEKIFSYLTAKDVSSKSFIHRLMQIYALYYQEYENSLSALQSHDVAMVRNRRKINLYYRVDDDIEATAYEAAYYSKWYWRFIYYIKRTKNRAKSLIRELDELEEEIVKNRMIKHLYLPLRWVELLTKKINKNT